MTRRRADRGAIALPVAMILVAVVAAVAATIVSSARVETTVLQRRVTTARALAAVDGCIDHVIAQRPAGWDFLTDTLGPDGIAATGDDGALATPAGCTAFGTAAAERLVVLATARVPDGARTAEAVVGRAAAPGVAAPLWVTSLAGLSGFSGVVVLDGPPATPVPAIAAPVSPLDLDAWLASHPNVTSNPGTSPPHHAPSPPLAALAARSLPVGVDAATALVSGTPVAAVAFVDADLLIDHPLQGAGILVVTGQLHVGATLQYQGVIAALAGIQIDPTATLVISGALWLGADPGSPNDLRGSLSVTFDPASLALADAQLPLPRPARLLSLRDREP